jgi:hypothetical protein
MVEMKPRMRQKTCASCGARYVLFDVHHAAIPFREVIVEQNTENGHESRVLCAIAVEEIKSVLFLDRIRFFKV